MKPVLGVLRLPDFAFGEMSLNETILSYGELLVLAHDRESRPHVGRIVYDEDHVDLDRDTLTATRELELGTSDWALDSNADGVDDGVELGLFETSPTDAATRPPVAEMAWRWGPSTRLDLERRTEAVFQPQRRDHGVPADCEFTPDGLNLDCSDLGAEDPVPAQVRFDTVDLPTPDFQTRFRRHDGPDPRFVDGFERYDLDAATPNALFPFSEPGVATVNSIVAVSADTLYLTAAVGPSGALRLWRVTADGSVELDLGSGCPLAPADPVCGLRYDPGRVMNAELVGVDAGRGAAFLRVETSYTSYLTLLAEDGVRPLRDLGWLGRGARVVAPSPFVDEIFISDPGHAFSGGRRLGADWAGERFLVQSVGNGGVAPYAAGFGDDVMFAWLVDDAQAGPGTGCVSIGGLRACDIALTGATAGPERIPHEIALVWQPIDEALTPGEVLFGGWADGFDEATGARRTEILFRGANVRTRLGGHARPRAPRPHGGRALRGREARADGHAAGVRLRRERPAGHHRRDGARRRWRPAHRPHARRRREGPRAFRRAVARLGRPGRGAVPARRRHAGEPRGRGRPEHLAVPARPRGLDRPRLAGAAPRRGGDGRGHHRPVLRRLDGGRVTRRARGHRPVGRPAAGLRARDLPAVGRRRREPGRPAGRVAPARRLEPQEGGRSAGHGAVGPGVHLLLRAGVAALRPGAAPPDTAWTPEGCWPAGGESDTDGGVGGGCRAVGGRTAGAPWFALVLVLVAGRRLRARGQPRRW